MIYKHMYCGYKNSGKVSFKENDKLITRSVASYDNMTFIYFETTDRNLDIYDICIADMKPFPDGREWIEMTEIFHYYTPEKDSDWERKIPDKTPVFFIEKLKRDKIASYVYYHVEHQNGNQYDCDRYYSIFLFDDIIVSYSETPTEIVQYEEMKDKLHVPVYPNWSDMMMEHFAEWPDGTKVWRRMAVDSGE